MDEQSQRTYSLEKLEEAVECCDKALKIKPILLPALFLKIRTLQTLEKFRNLLKVLTMYLNWNLKMMKHGF